MAVVAEVIDLDVVELDPVEDAGRGALRSVEFGHEFSVAGGDVVAFDSFDVVLAVVVAD